MGNRVWRQSTFNNSTTTRKYIVDIAGGLPTILCELDASDGSLKKSYFYADGQILSQRVHTNPANPTIFTPYFYVHDRIGSVRLVIDSAGTVKNSYTYKPFGQFYDGERVETVDNPWNFTGQWYDAEIDQYYLRARQYDPAMMRFTSRDPMVGIYNEPLTLHKYLYCLNNPLNRVDLSGAYSDGAWWAQYEFWSEIGDEVVKGAAATLDGFNPIPFCTIFENVYANSDGSVDGVYVASRLVGSASRTMLSFALNAYAVKSILAASGASANLGERIVIGMLWKGVVLENTLGKGTSMTVAGASALVGAMGIGDNIFDVMDAVGY